MVIKDGDDAFVIAHELSDGDIIYARSINYGNRPGISHGWRMFRLVGDLALPVRSGAIYSRFRTVESMEGKKAISTTEFLKKINLPL